MGTIRNQIVIVQHWNKDKANKLRESAVAAFQEIADQLIERFYAGPDNKSFDVSKEMVTPVLESFINEEYTFFINGDCSKLGWEESTDFKKVRYRWVEEHKHDASYIAIVDIGEAYPPEVAWSNYTEEEEEQ